LYKRSSWLITLNTNKFPDEDDSIKDQLEEIIKKDLTGNTFIDNYVVIIDDKHIDDTIQDHIVEVKTVYKMEVGTHPKGGRVHAHVLIKITHDSKIRLNYDALRDLIKDEFGGGYMNAKIVSSTYDLRNYLNK